MSSTTKPAAAKPASRSAIAKDPKSSAQMLRTIFETYRHVINEPWQKEFAMMRSLAANPNTPPDILALLVAAHAPAFCRNPVAPFLLLEKPDFLLSLDAKAQYALLQCADAPAAFIRGLAVSGADAGIVHEARQHIAFEGQLSTEGWDTAFRAFCRAYCQNPASLNEKQYISDYVELGLLPVWDNCIIPVPDWRDTSHSAELIGETKDDKGANALVLTFASNVDPNVFYTLACQENPLVALALCLHEEMHPEILQMWKVSYLTVRHSFWAASNKSANTELLKMLCSHRSPAVRRTARLHSNAPPDAKDISRRSILAKDEPSLLWDLITGLREKLALVDIRLRCQSPRGLIRLSAVFALTNGLTRLTEERRGMLEDLSHDTNRFVRASAQAWLANPKFIFTWEDGA